ncbi:imidazoleglycerol-phosphate dehydratase HisB [Desulfallas thermosapovorans]|uniref:Imidazoleglycerol-phosphate dehydratase n=1 Tax=Desulfallas thermosapovorans DSM 6562 TaxID=1121431 RepID=A0A5S4ZUA3_9FIRM|nr:imidazoleglycerol-phosphate dehydratase HisB [Desulfallas thermosapovorans]TYO96266.1 imidazoleglycerol-phosphate dehydratase [Desulfallas thermosapovorans DSM 6562]
MGIINARVAEINRETNETCISLQLALDDTGQSTINTGVGFLDHMLHLLAKHGGMQLKLQARGDLAVDAHHTVEDVGICLGQALKKALGDKRGIERYGHVLLPMDEALVAVALDFSGRGWLSFDVPLPAAKVGDFDTELVEEFLRAFAINGALTLHVHLMAGKNTHHIIEAIFKGLGRVLRLAAEVKDPRGGLPSTKGVL